MVSILFGCGKILLFKPMIIELFLWALLIIFSPAIIVCAFITLAIMLIFLVFVIYSVVRLVIWSFKFITGRIKDMYNKSDENEIVL